MTDAVLSSVFQFITEKLGTYVGRKYGNLVDLENNLEKLQRSLSLVEAVVEDAEEKQATNTAVKIWLSDLKDVAFRAEELLFDDPNFFSPSGGSNFFSLSGGSNFFSSSSSFADEVKKMIDVLEKVADEGLRFNLKESVTIDGEWTRRETVGYVVGSDVYGREEDKGKIVDKLLLSDCEAAESGSLSCILIIGMGGLGKTTLAQLAYNDGKVTRHFDVQVWVFVSDRFDVNNIMMAIIESISTEKCHLSTMEAIRLKLRALLNKKRYLIVLDDVWSEDQGVWDRLRTVLLGAGGINGSKILITTRKRSVAQALIATKLSTVPYYLEGLSEDACWSLFLHRAFQGGEEQEHHRELLPVGRQIVRKCGGVALAAKALGSLMRFKRDVKEWAIVRDSELWKLEKCKSEVLPALRLSYSHLPKHLKCCFLFCSIFPRSYEIKREKLIQLWLAGGLIPGESLEDAANKYFDDLLWISFLQEMKECDKYKMHDVVYDLAQSIVGSEYTMIDRHFPASASAKQIRYSSIVCDFRSCTIPEELYEANHLRTLLLFSGGYLKEIPHNFYSSFKYLFALDLSGSGLMTLRDSIGALKHLKYIDLSYTNIRKLPDSINDLRSLQSLILVNCYNLEALPDLRKTKHLRHLNNAGCKALTSVSRAFRFGRGLSNLQTLPLFVIDNSSEIRILGNCNELRGILKIINLEKVRDFHDAKYADLQSKKYIQSLGLYWGNDDHCPNINPEEESDVTRFKEGHVTRTGSSLQGLEANRDIAKEVLTNLMPPSSLKRFLIKGYPGDMFPSGHFPDFLEVVDLISCRQSSHLPTLGILQHLTKLSLHEMHGVKRIGEELYGERNTRPFPRLEELVVIDFPNLEQWLFPESDREAFPHLRKLILSKCSELTQLPQISSIQHLELRDCTSSLVSCFQNITSLEKLVIEKVSNFLYFPGAFPSNNPLLRSFEIKSCPQLRFLPDELGQLIALESLTIRWCENLSSLPKSLHSLSALESLEIGDCYSLRSLPEAGTRGLSNLRSLSIESCSNLNCLSSMGFQYLTSLEVLTIMYCPRIVALPRSLEHLSALESFSILCCPQLMYLPEMLQNLSKLNSLSCSNLKVLPEWIEKLVSLRSLAISGSYDIRCLPVAMKCLTGLQHLSIQDCPQLQERCRQESGEDWPKIAHVPHKHIEPPNLKRPREEGSSSSNY